MDSGDQHRTLTSEQTYNFGSDQEIVLDLSGSRRRLLLTTGTEELGKGLQRLPTEAVLNYTEVFIGGVPDEVGNELGFSNFTGCLWMSTLAQLNPECITCSAAVGRDLCTYCSQKVRSCDLATGPYMVTVRTWSHTVKKWVVTIYSTTLCYQQDMSAKCCPNTDTLLCYCRYPFLSARFVASVHYRQCTLHRSTEKAMPFFQLCLLDPTLTLAFASRLPSSRPFSSLLGM